jgi:uncharacterized protein
MDTHTIQHAVQKYVATYGIELAVLFGSRARGTARNTSDVDIALITKPRITIRDLATLQMHLSETLGVRADLVDMVGAPPLLLKQIATEGILLHEKEPGVFSTARVHALMRYYDEKPLLDLRAKQILSPQKI